MKKGEYFYQPAKLKEIKELLVAKLINPKKPNIDQLYNQLAKYDKEHNENEIGFGNINDLREPFKDYLASFNGNLDTIAIDFPIFLKSRENTDKTIMICAMDSLPPEPDKLKDEHVFKRTAFDRSNNIGFWAPFSLIADWEHPTGSMTSNLAFFEGILDNYNVYVTDIYKIFFRTREQKTNKLKKSNQLPKYKKLKADNRNVHATILEKEIEIIKPNAIITLGNASRDRLLKVNESFFDHEQCANPTTAPKWGEELQEYKWKNKIDIISSPHISGGANGPKMQIINAHPVAKEEGYENKKLAKIICDKIK